MVVDTMEKEKKELGSTEEPKPDSKPQTRVEKKQQESEEKPEKKRRWHFVRKFPILLRIVVVLALLALSLALGLMVGYGVIGDGNPSDALQKDTWQHILDIINKE